MVNPAWDVLDFREGSHRSARCRKLKSLCLSGHQGANLPVCAKGLRLGGQGWVYYSPFPNDWVSWFCAYLLIARVERG